MAGVLGRGKWRAFRQGEIVADREAEGAAVELLRGGQVTGFGGGVGIDAFGVGGGFAH